METIRARMTARLLGEASGPLCGIYVITHRASGKRYVGQSLDIRKRWRDHLSTSNCRWLAAALKKYGPDAFDWEIVEPCQRGELDDREAFYIFAFDCLSPKGYNLKTGGGQAQCYTAEARAALAAAMRRRLERPGERDYLASRIREAQNRPEVRAKASTSMKKAWARPEVRAKMTEAVRLRSQNPHWRAKQAEAARQAKADPTTYTIINVKTGQRDTGTRLDFRERYGIDGSRFGDLLSGTYKTSKGWRLALAEEL